MNTYYARHVDDGATTLTEHYRSTCVDEVECALQVHVQNGIPLSLAHTEHKAILGDTGIVYENVDGAEVCMYLLYYSLCLGKICSVAGISQTLYAQSLNLLACSLKTCLHVIIENKVGEGDVCAF